AKGLSGEKFETRTPLQSAGVQGFAKFAKSAAPGRSKSRPGFRNRTRGTPLPGATGRGGKRSLIVAAKRCRRHRRAHSRNPRSHISRRSIPFLARFCTGKAKYRAGGTAIDWFRVPRRNEARLALR